MQFDCRNCSYSIGQHLGSRYKCPGEGVESYLRPWDGSSVPTDRARLEETQLELLELAVMLRTKIMQRFRRHRNSTNKQMHADREYKSDLVDVSATDEEYSALMGLIDSAQSYCKNFRRVRSDD